MKGKYYNRFIVPFVVLCMMLFTSCKKFVTLNPPVDKVSGEILFSDSANATAAVLGIYQDAVGPTGQIDFINSAVTIYTGLYSDELYLMNPTSTELPPFYSNSLDSKNSILWSLWRSAYILIYKTNACIEGVTKSSTLSASIKARLTGEAKFARALFYYYLVRLFGDVPLVLGTDYNVNAILPRTASSIIYDQMIGDLLAAKEILPSDYLTTGRVRPNKYSVIALLARIYLEKKQWSMTEAEATLVIGNSMYSLENDLNNVFLPGSKEAIWQLIPPVGYETVEGFAFIPSSATAIPKYNISQGLLSSFEANDQRKAKWTKKVTIGGNDYTYPYKYKIRRGTAGAPPSERYSILRLAEVYLVRAEARANQNNIPGAKQDLDAVRNRAGLTGTTAGDQSSLIAAIYNERKTELFCELGHRWSDICRAGQVNAIMNSLAPQKGGAWNEYEQVFPIPFSQLLENPFLVQTPGY